VGHAFPENRILSHDLIEGNYARCGLVTDIELLDDFPALYPAYARREHRWVRGDWQILPWLFGRVPAGAKGTRTNADRADRRRSAAEASATQASEGPDTPDVFSASIRPIRVPPRPIWKPNPLPALERWKVFDNLRRSLVPPFLVVLLLLGWIVLPGSPWL